jgi:hypothetical protein
MIQGETDMERPPRGDGSTAARWAHQQNIGESEQDRQDWRDGVRCWLAGTSPIDSEAAWARAEDELAPGGRGYAPARIRVPGGEPSVFYRYDWTKRGRDGVHHYTFKAREVEHGTTVRSEVLARYELGPLHGQDQWVADPAPDGMPDTIRIEGDVHYKGAEKRGTTNFFTLAKSNANYGVQLAGTRPMAFGGIWPPVRN